MGKAASVALGNAFASKSRIDTDQPQRSGAHNSLHLAGELHLAGGADVLAPEARAHAEDQDQAQVQVVSRATFTADDTEGDAKDHFIQRNGVTCAGTHLIVDLFDASRLDELPHMESAFLAAVQAAGATLLHIHMHHFTPNGGISGVAVLAESHISVHTWPERNYAAFDVFMCGDARPELAVEVLEQHFRPGRVRVSELLRGVVSE